MIQVLVHDGIQVLVHDGISCVMEIQVLVHDGNYKFSYMCLLVCH